MEFLNGSCVGDPLAMELMFLDGDCFELVGVDWLMVGGDECGDFRGDG